MDYKTAAKEISKGNIAPIYVCYGPEKYLMHEFISYLTAKLIEPEHKEFAISRFDLSESPVETVVEDAETLPFMVPKKLIIARDALFFTAAKETSKVEHRIERLMEYIQSPVDYTVLIFTVSADKLDERKKLVKSLKERGGLISFLTLQSAELEHWIKRRAEKLHCTFVNGAADQLILYAGTNLQNLSTEIEKLSLYVGAGGSVTKDIVESLVVPSTEQNVFVLIEEIVRMRMERAFAIFYELLKQREEPIKILILIARQFRIMLQVTDLSRQGFSHQQIASQLGLHPYAVKVAAEQAKRYDAKRLSSILAQLAELDYQMKSGKIEKVLGLEIFLLKLAS